MCLCSLSLTAAPCGDRRPPPGARQGSVDLCAFRSDECGGLRAPPPMFSFHRGYTGITRSLGLCLLLPLRCCVCMRVCVPNHVHICVHACLGACASLLVCMCVRVCVSACVLACLSVRACVHACLPVCVHACVCIFSVFKQKRSPGRWRRVAMPSLRQSGY